MNSCFMDEALLLARQAAQNGEVPVGAVVVKNGKIISRAQNSMKSKKNALAHAELLAIKGAMESLGTERLAGCELYVTLEPCPMCAGAIINSRISVLVFGAYDNKAGAVNSVEQMFSLPYNSRPEVYGGIREKQCKELLSAFFENLR